MPDDAIWLYGCMAAHKGFFSEETVGVGPCVLPLRCNLAKFYEIVTHVTIFIEAWILTKVLL